LNGIAGAGFLVGETMSIADIAVVSNLVTYQYLGFDLQRARHSQLAELHDRVVRQPAMREALRREKPVVDSMGLSYESVAPLVA
jgi:glutathione S-transferase